MSKQREFGLLNGVVTRNSGSSGTDWRYRTGDKHYHAATPSKMRKYLTRQGVDAADIEAVAVACRRISEEVGA